AGRQSGRGISQAFDAAAPEGEDADETRSELVRPLGAAPHHVQVAAKLRVFHNGPRREVVDDAGFERRWVDGHDRGAGIRQKLPGALDLVRSQVDHVLAPEAVQLYPPDAQIARDRKRTGEILIDL